MTQRQEEFLLTMFRDHLLILRVLEWDTRDIFDGLEMCPG